jgi:hypothetical protein
VVCDFHQVDATSGGGRAACRTASRAGPRSVIGMLSRRHKRSGYAAAITIATVVLAIGAPVHAQEQVRPAIQSQADSDLISTLLRTTLVALHQANVTGNYTILRDIAAPSFQARNTAADLALIFAQLRRQNIDLAPAVLLEPQFTQAPAIDQQNLLRVSGTLPTKPVGVIFDLAFQVVNGSWRLFGISIGPATATAGQ